MPEQPAVGVIGLGIMGAPMARNLLRAGFPVVVHNRSREKVDALAADGAQPAGSPREVAERTAVTITIVPDSPDVEEVYLDSADGVLAGAAPGQLLIDMSTIAPAVARRVAAAAADQGADLLDAPVSGGDVGARDGTLSIMAGGSAAAFARAEPIFAVLGTTVVHVGESGAGQIVKACNQVVVALTIEALSEALVLGSKAGVDPAVILRALGGGLAGGRYLETRGARLAAHDFEPGFKLELHAKDLRIALAAARELGVELPNAEHVQGVFEQLVAAGSGAADNSILLTAVEARAGHRVGDAA